jgi:peptidoglycan/LPS O-acetylase OafA/YrhL
LPILSLPANYCMQLSIGTPALLFPAISLLMLAYTNRFLALASLIRNLHANYQAHSDKAGVLLQIRNLRLRLKLIRQMQLFGILSLFICVLSMFFIYEEKPFWADWLFAGSLVSMLVSLFLSLYEIQISTRALEIELSDIEDTGS